MNLFAHVPAASEMILPSPLSQSKSGNESINFVVYPAIVSFKADRLYPDWDECVTIPIFIDAATPTDWEAFNWWSDRLRAEVDEGLRITLVGDEVGDVELIHATFSKIRQGVTWIATFRAKIVKYGSYRLQVTLRGDDIPGSPFRVFIHSG